MTASCNCAIYVVISFIIRMNNPNENESAWKQASYIVGFCVSNLVLDVGTTPGNPHTVNIRHVSFVCKETSQMSNSSYDKAALESVARDDR